MNGQGQKSTELREGIPVWTPDDSFLSTTNIVRFMNTHGFSDYDAFYEKTVRDPDWFYPAVLAELDIPWIRQYEQVVDLSNGMEMPLWFRGGETNVFSYTVEKHVKKGRGEQLALIWEGEEGEIIRRTFAEVKAETDRLASALKKMGVKKGDRVGVFLPQIPEIQPILFACAKIGAVVIPCFSGFGAGAVAVRLRDGGARWLFTADGYFRKGKIVEMKKVADSCVEQVPTLEKVIVVPRLKRKGIYDPSITDERDLNYDELLKEGDLDGIGAEPMKSDEPFLIIYTSGTTGKPKGTRHTHYSFPLKNAIDMFFLFDVKRGDRMFWLTDIGWMMGPWHILGTAVLGAAAVMYEGSPDFPDADRLWQLVEKHRISIFGVSPTVVRSLMRNSGKPAEKYDLTSLRILGSTGEPWNPKPWLWFFENVGGRRCPIINYSGGTEISGGILGCLPIKPLKPASFHGPVPGMSAMIVDESGNEIQGTEVGDLAINRPFLGMTYSFWNDHKRYLDTYWSRWEGLWYHGDFARKDEDGFWYILGRSDDTMNVAGKRLGPAELESVATSLPFVREAAAIGIPDETKGEVPVLFIVPNETADGMEEQLKQAIRERLGKAFLPKEIHFVKNLPRTQSGKVSRRVIRSAYLGNDPGDLSTLENQNHLQEFRNLSR